MKSIKFALILVFLIIFSISCAFVTESLTGGGGPKNFTAVLTAPDVVLLTWDAVEGASGYILELSIDNGESIPIIELPPELTSYEDLTAPELGNLTYQVQVVTESGPAGKSQVTIETGKRQPNPLTVTPQYDEENAIATTVDAQGGEVSLVDSNEVQYTLNIPAGALSADTEIRMTAVTSIQDWPLDGAPIGAVRLEPEGLVLSDVAILTMRIPLDLNPDLALVGFEFQADGQEFHLQPTYEENGLTDNLPDGSGHLAHPLFQEPKHIVRMPLVVLKVNGLGEASHESVSQYAKDHSPTDAGAALEQKRAAEAVADDELAPLKSTKGWKPLPPAREEARDIASAIYNAKNCQDLNSQIVSFQKWRFSKSYSELNDDQRREYTKQIWDELTDKVKEVLENAATECEKSKEAGSAATADSSCAKALLEKIMNPPSDTATNFNSDLKNKLENKTSDKELQDISDNLEKCKPQAYTVEGTWGVASLTGVITGSPENPFTLASTAGGDGSCNGEVVFSGGLTGGEVSCSQTCGDLYFVGSGSYDIAFDEDAGTVSGSCSSYLPASGGLDIPDSEPINVTFQHIP